MCAKMPLYVKVSLPDTSLNQVEARVIYLSSPLYYIIITNTSGKNCYWFCWNTMVICGQVQQE